MKHSQALCSSAASAVHQVLNSHRGRGSRITGHTQSHAELSCTALPWGPVVVTAGQAPGLGCTGHHQWIATLLPTRLRACPRVLNTALQAQTKAASHVWGVFTMGRPWHQGHAHVRSLPMALPFLRCPLDSELAVLQR